MHIAYSALTHAGNRQASKKTLARYRGYIAACQKHHDTIKAIQQYLPNWQPLSPGSLQGPIPRNACF